MNTSFSLIEIKRSENTETLNLISFKLSLINSTERKVIKIKYKAKIAKVLMA